MSTTTIPNNQQFIGDDLLRGAEEIARAAKLKKSQVYYLYRTGQLPVGKDGRGLISSISALQAAYSAKINPSK
jgi:hypothetical protein